MARAATSRAALVALLAANLFVAWQTFRHDWGYDDTMLIYWCEVMILGFYNVLRMFIAGVAGAAPLGSWASSWIDLGSVFNRLLLTLFGVGFFVVKFGVFALAIGLFVVLLPAMLHSDSGSGARVIQHALSVSGPGTLTAVVALFVSHGVSFVRNFLIGREYDRVNVLTLVFWPYARMSFVAGILLIGITVAALVPGLRQETGFALTMVILKLGADLLGHLVERRFFRIETGGTPTGSAPPVSEAPGAAPPVVRTTP